MIASDPWDTFIEGETYAEAPDQLDRAEDISDFCAQFSNRSNQPFGSCKSPGVLFGRGATLLTDNKEHFSNGGPTNWHEFWDTKDFPGARAMPARADTWRQLIVALVADDVAVKDLYPMDIDRAFKKLDELKPHISLWWTTGDQTTHGFRNGEYDAGFIWMTRPAALKNQGQRIACYYDGALLVGDRYAVVKRARHKTEALEMLKFFLDSPEIKGKICAALACTPPSADALQYMTAGVRTNLPSAEQISSDMVVPDAEWINANKAMLIDRTGSRNRHPPREWGRQPLRRPTSGLPWFNSYCGFKTCP
ncbi:extracellular solute-binding protein [Bradyrhizobium sp. Arg314]